MKPTKVKQVLFFGKDKLTSAAVAAVSVLSQYDEAAHDAENAKALVVAARAEIETVAMQFRDADITIEPRASEGTLAKEIFDSLQKGNITYETAKNYLSAFRRCVNDKQAFNLNPSRANNKRKGGKAGGRERLVEKGKTTYSINARSDTPTAKLVSAIKQFGEFLRVSAQPDDAERLALAAYLADADDVANGSK